MVTLSELLKSPSLSEITVAAGEEGLTNSVLSVSVMDAPDSYKWLRGGELILTSAYLFGGDVKIMLLSLNNLIEAGASGLGIKKNRFLREIPKEVINLANRRKFPILQIPYRFGWSEISGVFYAILYSAPEKAQSPVNKRQTEQIYKAARYGREYLLLKMTELFKIPMAIVQNAAIRADNGFPGVKQIRNTLLTLPGPVADGLIIDLGGSYFTIAEIPFYESEQKDYLALITQNRDFLSEIRKLFHLLKMLSEQDGVAATEKTQLYEKLIAGLVSGKNVKNEIDAAANLRKPNEITYTGVILAQPCSGCTFCGTTNNVIKKINPVNKSVLSCDCYMSYSADEQTAAFILELRVKGGVGAITQWALLFSDEMEYALAETKDCRMFCGAFHEDLSEISKSFAQAKAARDVGRLLWHDKRFCAYSMLSAYALLYEQDLANVDLSAVNALAAAGAAFSFDAVLTVETYIEQANLKKAADALFIHENTMRYRLQKINGAFHLDLDDPYTANAILTQIKIKRLQDGQLSVIHNDAPV